MLTEVDYMSDADFETIYAITFEAPERIGCMIASTPTGRRGMFYKVCTMEDMKFNQDEKVVPINTTDGYHYDPRAYEKSSAEGWKEFYFPTMVNPEWSPKMERQLKGQFSAVAYEHEVLAEFGTETVGVFNKDMVDEASSQSYGLNTWGPVYNNGFVAIGVDWDKFGASTNIVVVEYDPHDTRRARPEMGEDEPSKGRFKVINRIEVPKSELHYDKAVEMIQELDAKYNPFAIYCDRGSGEYQIELLRKNLGEKVKGIHLGSSYEVKDPISRRLEKKPLKPFLVNQTTLILERGQLRIPNRHVEETIHRQMINYQVVKVSAKSQEPVFSSDDEHSLDAMMFCLFAFIEKYPDLVNTIHKIEPAKLVGISKRKTKDPLKSIPTRFEDEGRDLEWDEPSPPPPTRVKVGTAKRNNQSQGMFGAWGNRSSMSKRPIRRNGFF